MKVSFNPNYYSSNTNKSAVSFKSKVTNTNSELTDEALDDLGLSYAKYEELLDELRQNGNDDSVDIYYDSQIQGLRLHYIEDRKDGRYIGSSTIEKPKNILDNTILKAYNKARENSEKLYNYWV